MKTLFATLAAVLATAKIASAEIADGTFQVGICTDPPHATVIQLEDDVLTFTESVCRLEDPQPVDGTAGFAYVGHCAGEGQTWVASMILVPLDAGRTLRVTRNGFHIDYLRCTP